MSNTYYHVVVEIHPNSDEENAKARTSKENYLVQAVSVTDAEIRIYEYFKNMTFTFKVLSVKKSNFLDVLSFEDNENEE